MSELAKITKEDITKVEDLRLTTSQLNLVLKKTPKPYIYERPAKGGGTWKFVTGGYVKKVLNLMFGWDWSFEVVEHKFDLEIGQAYVLGKLTFPVGQNKVTKMQFGRVDIKFKRGTKFPLDIGNDLKAATTDALKKCAAELGIAADIYNAREFREIEIKSEPTTKEKMQELKDYLVENMDTLSSEDIQIIRDGIKNNDVKLYNRIII